LYISTMSLSELIRKIFLDYESYDFEGAVASHLHEDFKYQSLPASLKMPAMTKTEYIPYFARLVRDNIAEMKVSKVTY
jgi:hypothetical protein